MRYLSKFERVYLFILVVILMVTFLLGCIESVMEWHKVVGHWSAGVLMYLSILLVGMVVFGIIYVAHKLLFRWV